MITYNDVINNAQSKDCSIKEFQDTMWQYIKEKMTEILKSGNVDANLVKTLVSYRGNSYGAHAMLLDMAPIKSLYEDISWFICDYVKAHENIIDGNSRFSWFMIVYAKAVKTKKDIENEIRNNPMIENLCKNGHSAFANKAIRLLVNDDEENKRANKVQQRALYNMRAEDFFKILKKVVEELGE